MSCNKNYQKKIHKNLRKGLYAHEYMDDLEKI